MRGEERNKRRTKKKKGSIISGVDTQRRGHTLVFRRKKNTLGKFPLVIYCSYNGFFPWL